MPSPVAKTEPAWMTLARGERGVREGDGAADNPTVLQYYADAGHPDIDHDSVAWCAAFACAMLERAGFSSPKQLTARSFLTWGKEIGGPRVGAIVVLKRGRSAWQGHVGFVAAWGEGWVAVLGGNQGDSVSVEHFPTDRVLGYRMPVTVENSRTVAAAVVGATSGAVSASAQTIASNIPEPETLVQMAEAGSTFATSLGALADFLPVVSVIAALITVFSAAICLYARLDDLNSKGR